MVLAHNILESERTTDVQISQDVTFDTMLLSSSTIDGLKESGFFKPSPIQLHAVPLGKCGFGKLIVKTFMPKCDFHTSQQCHLCYLILKKKN